jgi:hypothetical protein
MSTTGASRAPTSAPTTYSTGGIAGLVVGCVMIVTILSLMITCFMIYQRKNSGEQCCIPGFGGRASSDSADPDGHTGDENLNGPTIASRKAVTVDTADTRMRENPVGMLAPIEKKSTSDAPGSVELVDNNSAANSGDWMTGWLPVSIPLWSSPSEPTTAPTPASESHPSV